MNENEGTEQGTQANPSAEQQDDPIKQLKGEFNRKIGKTNELISQLVSTQTKLQEALSQISQPKKTQVQESADSDVDMEDLMYKDPKKYANIIKETAKREAIAEMRQQFSSEEQVKGTIAQLAAEYPELSDSENELTKAAAEILKHVGEHERSNPRIYEYAVMKAAQKLDVKPRSKRPSAQDEDFASPVYSSPQQRSKKRSSESVVTQNKDVAKAFGVNLDDPKMKERYLNLLKQKGVV